MRTEVCTKLCLLLQLEQLRIKKVGEGTGE